MNRTYYPAVFIVIILSVAAFIIIGEKTTHASASKEVIYNTDTIPRKDTSRRHKTDSMRKNMPNYPRRPQRDTMRQRRDSTHRRDTSNNPGNVIAFLPMH